MSVFNHSLLKSFVFTIIIYHFMMVIKSSFFYLKAETFEKKLTVCSKTISVHLAGIHNIVCSFSVCSIVSQFL